MKAHHFLGMEAPKRGDVGLELEVESFEPLPEVNEKSWRSKKDNSLRGYGMEYYSKQPIPLDIKKKERIEYLCGKVAGQALVSPRTSFHVHVNVTDLSPTGVWTGACAFWLLDNLLTDFCDGGTTTRAGNVFALRLTDAEDVIPHVLRDFRNPTPFQTLNNDRIRYSSLNLAALGKFGSLEARAMRGSTDPWTLNFWSTLVHNIIHNAAARYKSPAYFMDAYYREGPAILSKLITQEQVEHIARGNWEEMIEQNEGLVCEIAYAHSWARWEKKLEDFLRGMHIDPNQVVGHRAEMVIADEDLDLPVPGVLQVGQVNLRDNWVVANAPPGADPEAVQRIQDYWQAAQAAPRRR